MEVFLINLNTENNKPKLERMHHKLSGVFLEKILKDFYQIDEKIERNKKPYLKNGKINFSVSHSNQLIGIAFSKNLIGFDIEFKRERNYKKILERFKVSLENNNCENFYQFWTKYEAEYKSGFSDKIKNFNYKNYSCTISHKEEEKLEIFELKDDKFNNITNLISME